MREMNLEDQGLRSLTTYQFNEEEKKNRLLNFIGGFEIIDNEFRLFVVEGIS